MENFKFENIDVNKISTSYFQVKQKNHVANIDILEESIKKQGLLQPIGLAKTKITEVKNSSSGGGRGGSGGGPSAQGATSDDDYEWELLWGHRRLLVFMRLGHKTIPAMVLDKVLTKEEGMAIALAQSKTKVDMSKKDIYDAIKMIWIETGDARRCADETGIPLALVRDAIKDERVERTENGRAIYNHATNECGLTAETAHKILDAVRKADNVSADLRKGKKLANVLSVEDVQMRNKILKAAQNNPEGDVDEWVIDAKNMKSYKKRTIDLDLIEEEEYALYQMAEAYGVSPEEMIRKILNEKIAKEKDNEEEL